MLSCVVDHDAFWTALLNEVRPGPKFSMMHSDGSIERNLSERGDMQHMHVREDAWGVMYQGATDEGAAQRNLILRALFLRDQGTRR